MRAWFQTDVSASLPAGLGLPQKEGRIGLEQDSMRRNQRRHRERSVAMTIPSKRCDAPVSCLLVSLPAFALGR
jgi:hypothetical protein